MKEFILIVDDDEDIRKLLGIYLGNEGYRYLACENAAQALEVLEHYQVDLILLDVMMPGIDGISACLRIREKNKMPIIFMSAKSEDMDIIQGLTTLFPYTTLFRSSSTTRRSIRFTQSRRMT